MRTDVLCNNNSINSPVTVIPTTPLSTTIDAQPINDIVGVSVNGSGTTTTDGGGGVGDDLTKSTTLKNTRSSSLPLKIMLKDGRGVGDGGAKLKYRQKTYTKSEYTTNTNKKNNDKIIQSWNGMDTFPFLMNQCANNKFILYTRFSLSEHFLNLIGGNGDNGGGGVTDTHDHCLEQLRKARKVR